MKKLILSAALICSSLFGFSQILPSFQFGIKAGANLSKLSTENTFDSDNRAGYYGGFWARIGAAGIHLQPELYLSGKNTTLTDANGLENEVKFTSLDVPVLVGTKIGAAGIGLRLNTGPVVSFILNDEQKFGQAAGSVFRGDFKGQSLAWQFGAGLDIKNLGVDVRFEQGLSKIGKDGYDDTKLSLFTIGLAYKLF
ncbi:porin family protein [Pedobacter metabolipauper]|uniref:Outer membrane protein with beta-barrel domain n=1 Tax=Pedobacter metabolipauper TaxID=425513 RepID=A0A4R6SUC6_9SPHI|nr:porin family protein [Pedobacter metabolipauper]TDQ08576.1 outer membrane protein with beta-barrel domain [Pedobacter metabolipauper]